MPALAAGTLDAIHEYGGRMHKECVSSMSFVFRSEEFTARYHVPSYVRWLSACDMTPAYDWHRLVLQVLQRRFTQHPLGPEVAGAPALARRYCSPSIPTRASSSRIAIPLTVLGSVTSLVATLRRAHSDDVDYADIGRYHFDLYYRALDGLVDLTDERRARRRARPPHALRRRSWTTRSAPCRPWRTRSTTRSTTRPARRCTRTSTTIRRAQHGAHHYSFDDLGFDATEARARFTRYQSYFDVPDEV